MANKAISCGAYIQFILDDEFYLVEKTGVTITNPYGGSINNIAIFIEGETETPHWVGDYTTFDNPSAGSGAALKTAIDALLTVRGIMPNDSDSPGNHKVYATNSSGTKGWETKKCLLYNNLTPVTVTNPSTSEEVLHAIQVPAGLVDPNDMLEFFSQFQVTGSANNKTFRVYIDATGDLTGAILIGTFTTSGATVQMSTLYRFLPVLTDTSIEALASASTSVTGNYSQPNAVNTQITVPSLTAGFYIVITGQKASGAETLTCRWTKVEIKKP